MKKQLSKRGTLILSTFLKNNTALQENEIPETPIGLYKFKQVPLGNYILVLKKEGYFPRFAKININNYDFLIEHKELIPGFLDNNLVVNENTIAKIKENIAQYGNPLYKPMYDLNGDLRVDFTDISILKVYLGFYWNLYLDTLECFPE